MSILKPGLLIFTFNLYIFSSEYEIAKAVLIFLPRVFSAARGSTAARDLLKHRNFGFNPQYRPISQENWDQLISSSYKACELALSARAPKGGNPTIPDPDAEIGTLSRGSAFYTMLWSCVCLARDSPS